MEQIERSVEEKKAGAEETVGAYPPGLDQEEGMGSRGVGSGEKPDPSPSDDLAKGCPLLLSSTELPR